MYTNEMDKDEIIKQLQDELYATKQELSATKEHLKKYTAPERNKAYYQRNKEIVKQRVKDCQQKANYVSKVTPEQRKEYNKLTIIKNYFLQLMQKNIYNIFVPGLVFLLNAKMTVGTQIAIEVFKNSPEPRPGLGKDMLIDEKRSGNYVILAKRHIFDIVEETHNVSLEVSRISNAETIDT